MNNSRDVNPNIKRVISVDFMGGSKTLDRNDDRKNYPDLHNLNRIRNYSVIETMRKSDIRESLFKDLITQTSEVDVLKNKDLEIHKINPLFKFESQEDLSKITDDSEKNIIKIEVNGIETPKVPTFEPRPLFEKNRAGVKEKKLNPQNTDAPKITVKSKFEDKFTIEDALSIATSNDEPIYMDPNDLIAPSFVSYDLKSEFKNSFSQQSTQLDSVSQKQFYPSISTDDSSSVHNSPRNLSFKTNSTVFQLKLRKSSEILSEVKLLRNDMNQMYIFLDVKPTDILYNLVLVNLYQKIWIGNLSSPTIGNYLHFGDQILAINSETPNDVESLIQLVKNSKLPLVNLKLRRLPYSRVIIISDIHLEITEDQLQINLENDVSIEILKDKFGIKLKQNTAKIEKIYDNGLFHKNGLKYDPNKVSYELDNSRKMFTFKKNDEKERLSKWVITEINGDWINYRSNAEEILARLKLNDTASIVVQPYDLVKSLFNQKKA